MSGRNGQFRRNGLLNSQLEGTGKQGGLGEGISGHPPTPLSLWPALRCCPCVAGTLGRPLEAWVPWVTA